MFRGPSDSSTIPARLCLVPYLSCLPPPLSLRSSPSTCLLSNLIFTPPPATAVLASYLCASAVGVFPLLERLPSRFPSHPKLASINLVELVPASTLSWGKTPQIPTRTGLKHKVSREFVLVWIETTPFVVCVVSPPQRRGQRGMFPLWGFPEGSPGHEQLLLVSVPTLR